MACHPASNSTFLLLISFHPRAFRVFRGSCCKSLKDAARFCGENPRSRPSSANYELCDLRADKAHLSECQEAGVRPVICPPNMAVVGSEEMLCGAPARAGGEAQAGVGGIGPLRVRELLG